MDSCHLFNFLFGTKKMTTELSKCFSAMGASSSSTSSKRSSRNQQTRQQTVAGSSSKSNGNNVPPNQSPPLSPLKQFQQRLAASLGSQLNSSKKAENDQHQTTTNKKSLQMSCDSTNCGTYRATLIDSLPDDEQQLAQNFNERPIDIVVNPSYEVGEPDKCQKSVSSTIVNYQDLETINMNNKADEQQQQYSKSSLVLVEPMQPTLPNGAHEDMNELKRIQSSEIDSLSSTNNDFINNNKQMMSTKCKRVVLYSDCEPSQEERQVVASSAEIYNIVSELGETRAKLRRVGSLTNRQYTYDNLGDNKDKKITTDANFTTSYHEKEDGDLNGVGEQHMGEQSSDRLKDKRNVYVRSLVQSIESSNSFDSNHPSTPNRRCNSIDCNNNSSSQTTGFTKPITFVKPMPPKTPPKTVKAKCLNIQLSLNKPIKIQQLFHDESFLVKFFSYLDPLDRCAAAQVCRSWRNVLYSNQSYWKDLVMVVDCTQMRREHLVDCILSTLQTAKLKQNKSVTGSDSLSRPLKAVRSACNTNQLNQSPSIELSPQTYYSSNIVGHRYLDNQSDSSSNSISENLYDRKQHNSNNNTFVYDFDSEDVWRIQELCNRYTQRTGTQQQVAQLSDSNGSGQQQVNEQQQQQKQVCTASKSSSIPSQISSTISSVSLSSLLSPLSESSRIESLKEKLYVSLDNRGFDSLCLFGATNDDIDDLISKTPIKTHKKIVLSRLNNCSITNSGLELFNTTFDQLEELELSGCNEITNSLELTQLSKLRRLIITDCINIADGLAQKLAQILNQLDELTIQAYHLTDAFLEYLSQNSDTSKLKRLDLPNCKEITNHSLLTISKHFPQLEALSISGSTKITDEGIEILAEQARQLKVLDLSWCSRITDASLECIACDLGDTLTDLILDRNIHITDIGLGYLATMSKLKLLHIRWCPRVTDVGLESIIAIKSLRYLSLAGIHQITARSLLCLVEANLLEVELTNCPAVNHELSLFLSAKMPNCNIIF